MFFSKISPIILPFCSSYHPSLPPSLLSSLTSPVLFVPGRSRSMVLTLYCLVCPGPTFSVSLSQLPSHRGPHSSRLSVFSIAFKQLSSEGDMAQRDRECKNLFADCNANEDYQEKAGDFMSDLRFLTIR